MKNNSGNKEIAWHSLPLEEVRVRLSASPDGLSESEAQARLGIYGKNVLHEEKTSRFAIFLRQFNNILVYILIIAAIISLLVSDIKDFFIIVFIISINNVIGFWQELKAEASLAALKKMTESRVCVLRDG